MNRKHQGARLRRTTGRHGWLASLLLGACACGLAAEGERKQTSLVAPAPSVTLEHLGKLTTYATLAEALDAAQEKDVLRLAAGTHRGPVILNRTGLVLRGEPGARINANEPQWTPRWTPSPQYGRHAFTSPVGFAPGAVTLDDRILTDARESRGGLAIHAEGVGRGGRSVLQGIFTWIEKQSLLLVSFAEPLDLTQHRLEVSRRDTAAVTVRDADGCRVENLIITGGDTGVRFERTSASTVERCLIYAVDIGVAFGSGATACRVQSCDITWNPDALSIDCDPASGLAGDDTWKAHKQFGTYDKHGILANCSGADNEVNGCYLYNVWDGISTGDGVGKGEVRSHYENYVLKGISRYNRGLKVRHTRVDLAVDDALEPGNELVGAEWHGNIVTRARCGVRFKTLTLGPFFFYNNVIVNCGNGLRLYKSAPATASLYVAHNVVSDKTGIIYHEMGSVCWDDPWLAKQLPRGTPSFRINNNVFLCATPFANYDGNVAPNFQGDGNLYTAPDGSALKNAGIDTHSLFGVQPRFVAADQGNWRLADDSPGRGAGVTLPTADGVVWPEPLRVASGDHPDVGLVDVGEASTPRGPVSGLWDLAAQTLNLGERPVGEFRMEAQRWLAASAAEFPLVGLTGREDVVLRVIRTAVDTPAECRANVLDSAGTVLVESVQPPTRELTELRVTIPAAAQRQPLRLAVRTAEDTQWRVEVASGTAQVGMDFSQPRSLRKYDGGRYQLDYDVATPVPASFRVVLQKRFEAPCQVEVIRPGSEDAEVPIDGIVETKGVAGRYQLLLTFTKRADFHIEGPSPVACLSAVQETPPLRPRWGRPVY